MKSVKILLFVLFLQVNCFGQLIRTLAGNGSTTSSGNGGPAITAGIGVMGGVAHSFDYVYFVDGCTIRKVNISSGIVSNFAGTGTAGYGGDGGDATLAQLSSDIRGITYHNVANCLYIADCGNYVVRKIDLSTNVITTIAGNGLSGFAGDGGAATSAQFQYVSDVVHGEGPIIYIADWNKIREVDLSTGIIQTFANFSGAAGSSGDGGNRLSAKFSSIESLEYDWGNEALYIADRGNNAIRKIDMTTGNVGKVAGDYFNAGYAGDGNVSWTSSVRLSSPTDVSCTGNYLYIADYGNDVIRKIDLSTNIITTACGTSVAGFSGDGGPAILAKLDNPAHVDFNFSQTGYVVDQANRRIRLITCFNPATPDGAISEIDINTICSPGSSMSAPNPQLSVLPNDFLRFHYRWVPQFSNNVTLDNYYVSNPTITSIINPAVQKKVSFVLTVTGPDGCEVNKNVYTRLITSGYDLAVRDGHFDLYLESNPMELVDIHDWNFWKSPDIWNRLYNDPLVVNPNESPEWAPDASGLPIPNYLYTKVRNVGCDISPESVSGHGEPTLKTYWTIGGFGGSEIWPQDWNTTTILGTFGYEPQGLQIHSNPIEQINPGEYTIIKNEWTPPNPRKYALPYTGDITGSPDKMQLCFLARIEDYHDLSADATYGMTFVESTGINPTTNVKNNNNLSTLNTSVMKVPRRTPRRHLLTVGNLNDVSGVTSLQFVNNYTLSPETGISKLSDFISIEIYLGEIYDIWSAKGRHGIFNSFDSIKKSITFNGSQLIQLDSIIMDSAAIYQIAVEVTLKEGVEGSQMPNEFIHLRQLKGDSTNYVLGGYSFELIYDTTSSPTGVIAVTEVSNGPILGCQYIELIVGNCGSNTSNTVDIQGWIIDNYKGFDSGSCDSSHVRLKFDSVWANVSVGSIIVLYNRDANCYNMPDTFTIDTQRHIYWLPVGYGTSVSSHIEHFKNYSCNYCSDTGYNTYDTSLSWMANLDIAATAEGNGVQTRCPGCIPSYSGEPQIYSRLKYSCVVPSETLGSEEPAMDTCQSGHKWQFHGLHGWELDDSQYWSRSQADTFGTIPCTVGKIDSATFLAIYSNTFAFSCCGQALENKIRYSQNFEISNDTNALFRVNLYPNPTKSMLFFEVTNFASTTIAISDIYGRKIIEYQEHGQLKYSIDVHELKTGIYILTVTQDGFRSSNKIVIQ